VTIRPDRLQADLVSLVEDYCQRVCPAVLGQHRDDSVASPLGIWLLLALCVDAASGQDRTELEAVLGCSAEEAGHLIGSFLDSPPPALRSALALWVEEADITPAFSAWSRKLPRGVEQGGIPSQAEADRWADRHTSGLIKRFPIEIYRWTRLILTSALATNVSWVTPFSVAAAQDHWPTSSPWHDRVDQVLLDEHPNELTFLAATEQAGIVAVHVALARENVAVMSVSADPAVDRLLVFKAAYQLASLCRLDQLRTARYSLFDLPLGRGHSWEITEREVPVHRAGEHTERVVSTTLPAWRTEGRLDLMASPLFGASAAASALLKLIEPHPLGDEIKAVQSASASYSPEGFEAAAVSVLGIEFTGMGPSPSETGLEREASICIDHPYATIALSGSMSDFDRSRAGHSDAFCLPLFSAWVATPEEAAAERAISAGPLPGSCPKRAPPNGRRR
jgi:hypothetical protein